MVYLLLLLNLTDRALRRECFFRDHTDLFAESDEKATCWDPLGYQEQSSWIYVTVICLLSFEICYFCLRFQIKPFRFHFISFAPFSRYSVHCMSNCIPCIGFIYCFVSTADAIKYDVSFVANFLQLYLHFTIIITFFRLLSSPPSSWPCRFDISLSVHTALPSHALLWELTGRLPMLSFQLMTYCDSSF